MFCFKFAVVFLKKSASYKSFKFRKTSSQEHIFSRLFLLFFPQNAPVFYFLFFYIIQQFFCSHFLFSSVKNPKNAFKFPIFFVEPLWKYNLQATITRTKSSVFRPIENSFFINLTQKIKKFSYVKICCADFACFKDL